jgi:pimeloyl-ACP methyl ester carboxylesterase
VGGERGLVGRAPEQTAVGALLAGAGEGGAAAGVVTTASATPAGAHPTSGPKPTVVLVLVHGAFADASGWNDVIRRLVPAGYPVLAPANPLRGVTGDSAYLASILATITGPIVLVGHSYGGVIITNAATGNPNVKALVYVAAFAPDTGDTVLGLQTKFPGTKLGEAQLDFRPYLLPDGKPSADGTSRRPCSAPSSAAHDRTASSHRPSAAQSRRRQVLLRLVSMTSFAVDAPHARPISLHAFRVRLTRTAKGGWGRSGHRSRVRTPTCRARD